MLGTLLKQLYFPENEEIEYERSSLSLPVGKDGEILETVQLDAFLKLHRFKPQTALGIRHFEFQILRWEVLGKSEVFGGQIGFSLSDVPQPRSVCIANDSSSDFPATIIYNAIYDVYLNGCCVMQNLPGLGIGRGVMEIPPRDIPVTFQKPFHLTEWTIINGACNAMISMPEEDWEEAVARIVKILKTPI